MTERSSAASHAPRIVGALTNTKAYFENAGQGDGSFVRSNALRPTEEAYTDLLTAFIFLNEQLFDGTLSEPLLTLARKPRMLGAFAPNRFQRASGETAHEIILNPFYLSQRDDFDTLSTIAHEMAHQWREDFGPVGRTGKKTSGGYHDAVWADCMERIGLMPSHTGTPGGKRTGPRVSHYVIEDGAFDNAARELIASGFIIHWADQLIAKDDSSDGSADGSEGDTPPPPKTKKPRDRIKFSCGDCGLNAWAKPSAEIKCSPCDQVLITTEPTHQIEEDEA